MVETKDLVRACDLADPSEIGRVYQTIEGLKQLTKAINDGATSVGERQGQEEEKQAIFNRYAKNKDCEAEDSDAEFLVIDDGEFELEF